LLGFVLRFVPAPKLADPAKPNPPAINLELQAEDDLFDSDEDYDDRETTRMLAKDEMMLEDLHNDNEYLVPMK